MEREAGPDPLFARERWSFLAPGAVSVRPQFQSCLNKLRTRLRAAGLSEKNILRLTFFAAPADSRDYTIWKRRLTAVLNEEFGPLRPPASIVAQPPERRRRVALEAALVSHMIPDLHVQWKRLEDQAYSVLRGPDFREIHGAGIASARSGGEISASAGQAFEKMAAILHEEGLTFGQVVQQWNYIENITDVRTSASERQQNYQAFNNVRSRYYDGSTFAAGYPAATGIGQAGGGVVLEFVALEASADIRILPVSNPLQVDAHRYSAAVLVGDSVERMTEKTSPKFERAKIIARQGLGTVLVSGTAAVLGENSVGQRDVEAQTRTTVDNIKALVRTDRLERAGLSPGSSAGGLSYLRAYVKKAADIPGVRRICERAFGQIPALYVRADVCRDELLVELEGYLTIRMT